MPGKRRAGSRFHACGPVNRIAAQTTRQIRSSMINVFLDDLRPRPKGYLLARSVQECIKLIRSHEVGVLSLDYNLGRGRPTGASVVGYIIKKKRYPKKIILHTADRSGRRRMYRALKRGMPKTVDVLIRPKPTFVGSRSTG